MTRSITEGNYKTVFGAFSEQIERVSENEVTLYSSDVLGLGTVG